MIKTYRLNAILPLLPLAREDLPLLASFNPFAGVEPWLIRYLVDSEGFWLQANDQLGSNPPPLSFHEFEGMTGLTEDELEPGKSEGMGFRWGLPGGKPILPLPFTAGQFLEFANRLGDVARGVMPLNADDAAQFVTELAQRNPDAAELARIILSGVAPTDTEMPAPKAVAALDDEAWKAAACKRAVEIIKRQRDKELFPSQIHIADEIAREFRAAGVVGVDGKPLTGSTIKRHALTGISSAQGKQLSTRTGRGK